MQCPLCQKGEFDLRNVGFVNCEWTIRGVMKKKGGSKFNSEGKTYDGKLYTFQEQNLIKAFDQLDVLVAKQEAVQFQNYSQIESELYSVTSGQE
mmetsp:Transcript_8303/g.7693  ORF Transcript_8303/g.7693 Transcript_8303/m.7693 type:complete len:94 (+) Transcript_8303:373-654(+)|eukprot:CAMPEP_0170568362 /NCGR_PEP_ID=MMETSP0211-20121228/81139_1 /TAXON_ID=311385 /ORGANISM="Pseudokeronopsis sp., Strain OXSARD2" /LENGTH=93 /DNA_ID=CAMNT_0010890213 /DNA_START=840 /DNA_END=1121 /DNA_ORIENTATION=-